MIVRTTDLNQVATYWAPLTNDGFGGVTFDAPLTIACRWQNTNQRFRTPTGDEVVSSSVVYVDRLVEIGGKLIEGEVADADPVEAAKEIRQRAESPDLDAVEVLVKVFL